MGITATKFLKQMRGGSQSKLMQADDGNAYVVRFRNNPQGTATLAKDWIASNLASLIGLPVQPCTVIQLPSELIRETPTLEMQFAGRSKPCEPGPAFGSQHVSSGIHGYSMVFDYLPEEMLRDVSNLRDLTGALLFDKWVCNTDLRQVVYVRYPYSRKFKLVLVDQGHCFGGEEWEFRDGPRRGLFGKHWVYENVRTWRDFEPWLSRLMALTSEQIWDVVCGTPDEWVEERATLEYVTNTLLRRRERLPMLVEETLASLHNFCPQWRPNRSTGLAIPGPLPIEFAQA